MCAFDVLGVIFHWLGERLQNELFCVEWDVKAQLSKSIAQSVSL